jgi:biotin transport system substrate-specific component
LTIALPRLDRTTADQRGITIADFLVPIRVGERISSRARHVALILAGTLIVALSARIYIPMEPVPFTGQTFGVLLVGGALGFRRAALALLLYLGIGIIGVPVFSQGTSGVEIVRGVTGGYLIGFVVAAAVVGRLAELGWDRHIGGALGMMLIGNALIYAIGVPWLMAVTGQPLEWAIANGMTPFLLWDALKLVAAGALFPLAWWVVGRRPGER